jgi:hypothetical protein
MPSTSSSIGTPLAVEVQLRQEKASALRRVGDKLEALIGQLTKLEEELRTLSGAPRSKKLTEYEKLWADADYQRWCLVIQREAMGLFDHAEVDLMYPRPPKLR